MAGLIGEVTERDLAFLEWIGRFRGVTSAQVAGWFIPQAAEDVGVRIVNRRLSVMRNMGLVTSDRVLAHHPAIHNLTRAGMNKAQVYGPVRSFSVGQLDHDLAVTDLLIWLKRRDGDIRSLTEREVRAIDTPDTDSPKYAVKALPGSGRRLIYPDLITISGNVGIAHEVENSAKEVSRLRALMVAYALNDRLSGVVYYGRPKLHRRLTSALDAARVEAREVYHRDRVSVNITGWDWQEES